MWCFSLSYMIINSISLVLECKKKDIWRCQLGLREIIIAVFQYLLTRLIKKIEKTITWLIQADEYSYELQINIWIQGLWILSLIITDIGCTLVWGHLEARINRRSEYSKKNLFQCSYKHITIVLRHTLKCVQVSFKQKKRLNKSCLDLTCKLKLSGIKYWSKDLVGSAQALNWQHIPQSSPMPLTRPLLSTGHYTEE